MTLLLLGDASVYGISRGPSHLVACGKSLARVSVSVFPLLYIYIYMGWQDWENYGRALPGTVKSRPMDCFAINN